jgi:transketolase
MIEQIEGSKLKELKLDILDLKRDILEMIYRAKSGHPGGSLSCVNLIYILYKYIMKINPSDPLWEKRDFFILSKGHAAPALYAVLSKIGFIARKDLFTLRQLDSRLQGHPLKDKEMGIEVTTGSLGMGLSIGVGSALGVRLNKSERRIYVLLGDGELNEGAIWEAAMSASHYKLDNLIAIVDRNGLQIDGSTEEVMSLEPLVNKWKAFGWEVIEVDGTNINDIIEGFKKSETGLRKPKVLISYLVKGSEVSFMEHVKKYHGSPPNNEEYNTAMKEIEKLKTTIRRG